MAHTANIPRPQRAGALVTVIVLHALLLAFFLATRGPAPLPAQMPGSLTIVSVADESAATPPPPPRLPSEVVLEDVVELAELALAAETDPNATAASASGCAALDTITKAILADPVAVAAVLRAPPETRSIAEAIVVWNSGWTDYTATVGAPLEPVRAAVRQSLGSIDEGCLDEPVLGPRLVPIPAGSGTMFLVFGSGIWTWRQLIVDPQPLLGMPNSRPVADRRPGPISLGSPRWN